MPHGVIGNTTVSEAVVLGSNPSGAANKCSSSSVGLERLATNEEVAGSSPAWSTKRWAHSSVGRAFALQAKGPEFESPWVHTDAAIV